MSFHWPSRRQILNASYLKSLEDKAFVILYLFQCNNSPNLVNSMFIILWPLLFFAFLVFSRFCYLKIVFRFICGEPVRRALSHHNPKEKCISQKGMGFYHQLWGKRKELSTWVCCKEAKELSWNWFEPGTLSGNLKENTCDETQDISLRISAPFFVDLNSYLDQFISLSMWPPEWMLSGA